MRPEEVLLFSILVGFICKSSANCTTGNQPGDCLLDPTECGTWGACSQKCVNIPGGFRCECVEGYYTDPIDHTRCKVSGQSPKLLVADGQDIVMVPLDQPHQATKLLSSTAVAFDYVWRSKTFVWSNGTGIKSVHMDTPGNQTNLLPTENETNITAIAMDWIHNNVYWTDGTNKSVSVMSVRGGFVKSLFFTSNYQQDQIVGIAVDPFEGWLYMVINKCSHLSSNGYIVRGRLDGSDISTVIRNLNCPSGITIDYILHRLYWLDAHTERLESCKFDGTDRRVILQQSPFLRSPFTAIVLEDFIYYSDRTNNTVYKVNKFNGTVVDRMLQSRREVLSMQVYHEMRQPRGENRCAGLSGCCSHLCLPGSDFDNETATVTCYCRNGSTSSENPRRLQYVPSSSEASQVTNQFDPSLAVSQPSNSSWEIIVLVGFILCAVVAMALALVNKYLRREPSSQKSASATFSTQTGESSEYVTLLD